MTVGESFMPDMAPDMVLSPMNKIPKPIMISPNFVIFCFLQNMTTITPSNKITGAIFSNLKETNNDVTVVPIFAPKITPAA